MEVILELNRLSTFQMHLHWQQDVMFCVWADEVLEQADYLYSCADTEKLYQLLLQYKDRWAWPAATHFHANFNKQD